MSVKYNTRCTHIKMMRSAKHLERKNNEDNQGLIVRIKYGN